MTLALAFVALMAAVNAPRARFALAQESPTERVVVAGVGATVALAGAGVAAAGAEVLRDAFGMSVETARIGVGVVVVLVGARDLAAGLPSPDPALPGRGAGLVPVAFPLLLNPAVLFSVFAVSLDHSVSTAVILVLPALAMLPLLAIVRFGEGAGDGVRNRVLAGSARVMAAVLVVAGVAMTVDGILDI